MSRPLTTVPVGATVQLHRVVGDRRTVRRLADLGLTPGVALTVLQRSGGPLILSVRGARVAIGRAMASCMTVDGSPTEEP